MALFGRNYEKPGPGVDKDEPQKRAVFLYLDIFTRKFTKLIQLNLEYSLFSLIWLVVLYLLSMICTQQIISDFSTNIGALDGYTLEQTEMTISILLRMMFVSAAWLMFGAGPASAGFSYVTRNFAREEHAWVWSDFKDKVKENFKQSIVIAILDVVITVLVFNACYFYYSFYLQTGSILWFAMFCVLCIAYFIYGIAHFFAYQLMVNFKLKFGQLVKNSLLFALAKLPMCLLFSIIGAGVLYLLFLLINPVIVFAVLLFGGYSIMRFPVEFYAARVINKMVTGMKEKNPAPAKITYLDDVSEDDSSEDDE